MGKWREVTSPPLSLPKLLVISSNDPLPTEMVVRGGIEGYHYHVSEDNALPLVYGCPSPGSSVAEVLQQITPGTESSCPPDRLVLVILWEAAALFPPTLMCCTASCRAVPDPEIFSSPLLIFAWTFKFIWLWNCDFSFHFKAKATFTP